MNPAIDLAETAVRKLAPAIWEHYQHFNYLTGLEPRKSVADQKISEAVRDLEANGMHIVENFMPAEWCDEVLSQIKPHLNSLMAGTLPPGVKYSLHEGDPQKRVLDIHKLVPKAWEYFGNPFMMDAFQGYAAQNLTAHQYMVDWRSGVGLTTDTDEWHFDDPYPAFKLKAFLYLNDVGIENGPFCYIPGTHINARWRKWKNRDAYVNQQSGDWGQFTANHVSVAKKRYGFKDKACTGKRGTLILFDSGGLHRSSVVRSGERYVLCPYYEIVPRKRSFVGALKRRMSPVGR